MIDCPDCFKDCEGRPTGMKEIKCPCGGFLYGCPYCGGDGRAFEYCDTCKGKAELERVVSDKEIS